jgi:hypothetical protein
MGGIQLAVPTRCLDGGVRPRPWLTLLPLLLPRHSIHTKNMKLDEDVNLEVRG